MPTIADKHSRDIEEQLDFLRPLNRLQLKMIYADLPAPSISDTVGEYSAALLNQDNALSNTLTKLVFQAHGPWIGKAFRPRQAPANSTHSNASVGEGYNLFKDAGSVRCKLQMDTYIGQSLFANGQSMILDYSRRNRGVIRWLVGELRQLDPTTLLGMGIFRLRNTRFERYKRVVPFILSGPHGEYRLD